MRGDLSRFRVCRLNRSATNAQLIFEILFCFRVRGESLCEFEKPWPLGPQLSAPFPRFPSLAWFWSWHRSVRAYLTNQILDLDPGPSPKLLMGLAQVAGAVPPIGAEASLTKACQKGD